MKTTRMLVKVSALYEGYQDKDWDGVVGYDSRLDIRPAYQREFIYDVPDEQAVIATVLKGHPLNIMYWVQNGDNNYELLDGQQRSLSVCRFLDHKYYVFDKDNNKVYEDTMLAEERSKIMNYELDICVCEGTEGEILDWFKTINIKGKELNEQEALNATHTGAWLTDAKRYFSKPNCAAYGLGKNYVNGAVERQDFLATALKWKSNGDAQGYMAQHRNDADASELWKYFQDVIDWINRVFPNQDSSRDKLIKGLDWGKFYNEHRDDDLNAQDLEKRIIVLIDDDEVENKRGIYEYLLNNDERTLSLRTFDEKTKMKKYVEQKGICVAKNAVCGNKHFKFNEMEADHVTPWSQGGKTVYSNCHMLCRDDNRRKGTK